MATKKSNIDKSIDQIDGPIPGAEPAPTDGADSEAKPQPSFKKFEDSRIPISKSAGNLWKSRHDAAIGKRKRDRTHEAWDETVRYYKNDQTGKRNRDNPDQPGTGSEARLGAGEFANTENIVFANVSALVPSIYAKNPDVTVFSPKGDADMQFCTTAQKLLRTLMNKRTAPGINLKPKMRRQVVMTTLTNIGYIEVGYTRRENASESALAEIDAIATELGDENTTKERIIELEGQLQALDDKVDLLQPSGPWVRFLNAKDVLFDPDANLSDPSDAKWCMIKDVLDTSFINAVYRQKDENGQMQSLYKPTHVLKADVANAGRDIAGHDMEINNFSLLNEADDSPAKYGYDNEQSFKRAQRTFVWKVWDRITRRVYMYAANDWTWPIWVWDDPYGFDDFFPVAPLAFHSDPEEMFARGEVSYYLDQQDEVNKINSQVAKMRHRVSNMFVYDKGAVKDESTLNGLIKPVYGQELVGITVPEGKKLGEILTSPPIPAAEFPQLFDKKSLMEAIDRVSGVSAVVQGVQYKTNTTNKAIDSYESSSAQRLDEKIDAIEEQIGRIGYMVLFLCLQFMSMEEVVALIGEENSAAWPPNMSAKDAQRAFTLVVTGGSSLKPTSKVRKEQAVQTGQILGQFGQSNPVVMLVVLKMFARAYADEIVLEKADWDMIMQSTQQMIQAQSAPPPGGGEGGAPQQQQQEGAAPDPKAIIAKISEAISKMPDQLRHKIGADIAKGVPLQEILQKVMEVAHAGAQQQQPPQQQQQQPH